MGLDGMGLDGMDGMDSMDRARGREREREGKAHFLGGRVGLGVSVVRGFVSMIIL